MPVIKDKKKASSLKDTQEQCKICSEKPNRGQPIAQCDVCQDWICFAYADISGKLHEYITENNINYSCVCQICKDELPQIRQMMQMKAKIKKNEEEIAEIKEKINSQHTLTTQLEEKSCDHEARIKDIEKILKENKMDDDEFPKLPEYAEATKKLQDLLKTQQHSTVILDEKLQKHTDIAEEERRKAARQRNLIVYGIPETENDQNTQMKEDFLTIQDLYQNRVPLEPKDIVELTRLGPKKERKIRPIRITLISQEKRLKLLRNNLNLRMHNQEYEYCECKNDPGHHIHINVTNDKTQLERESEKVLRDELNRRRNAGEQNLIIKRGKITQRTVNGTQTRWADVYQDV